MDELLNMNMRQEDRTEFIHFDTTEKCEEFINQFGHSYIKHICCSGKGFGYINTIVNRARIRLITRRQNQEQEPSIQDIPIVEISSSERDISMEIDCTVCLEPSHRFTPCMHNLCIRCEERLLYKLCPICRVSIVAGF
jgi:hypothetical protein